MPQQLHPAGIRSLAIAIPTGTREVTLPSGRSALRHFLPKGSPPLEMEYQAVAEALDVAGLDPKDVDLVISASFPAVPEPCVGNCTPVAWKMGMEKAAAYNMECACAGGLVALRNACIEIRMGHYEHVLVSAECPYSKLLDDGHPATDVVGDAAFAMVVGRTGPGHDFLASVLRNSGPTCPFVDMNPNDRTQSGIRLDVSRNTAPQLEAWVHGELPGLIEELLGQADVTRDQVDHWIVNAPTESFAPKALEAMGARADAGVNTNRLMGNIGPSLLGVSLFYNVLLRDVRPGDLVLCCSVGSKASLALTLMRWPEDAKLGAVPAHATVEQLQAYEAERLGG